MQSFKFPQPLVTFLNAMYAGADAESAKAALIVYLQEIGLWLRHEAQLLIGAEEESAFNQLRSVGAELTETLADTSYARIEEVSHDFALALNRFRCLRSRLRFVDLVEIDELMQAAVAASNGKDCRSEVHRRLLGAVQLLQGLAEQISIQSPWLPEPVNEALEEGVNLVDEGLLSLNQWLQSGEEGPRGVRRPLLLLKNGANLLGYFVRWRLEQSGWHGPFADNLLWTTLYGAQQDVLKGAELGADLLPRLQRVAAEYRAERLLSARQHTALWAEWDSRWEELQEGSEDMLSLLQEMLALVEDMEAARLDTGSAFATFLEGLVLAGSGAWSGHVPHSYLRRELVALFPRAVGEDSLVFGLDYIRDFLEAGPRLSLCRGLEVVIDCAQTCGSAEAMLSGLRCRCCQQFFDPADPNDVCLSQTPHQYLAVCA